MTPRLQLCVGCKQYLPCESFTPSVRGKKGYRCQPCQKVANSNRDRTRTGRQRQTYAEKAAERRSEAVSGGNEPGIPLDSPETARDPSVGFSEDE